ncbi:MAG TPA: RNA polymerase sigma factor, partial [Patescibacteria group bacterium]|nr:RNA polymerase sigma factor [Patescibacteria group bacterium]
MTPTLAMHWMDSDRPATPRAGTPAARNHDALEAFLRGIERRALRMAELGVGSRDDALDIVQDCMLTFVRNYRDKPASDWAPLFHRVLDSRMLDFHRRHQVRSRWFGWIDRLAGRDAADEDAFAQVADPHAPQPWQAVADGETAAALDAALRALPNRQRQAFLLRIWEGLDVADTAQAMACSEGSVKTHLSRAITALRAR